jgi:F-type H+-transporting ATPase subunit delta
MSYVAFQYAEALFSLAMDQNEVEQVKHEFDQFTSLLDQEFKHFLYHPKVTKEEKKEVLSKVTDHTLFRHFLYVLVDRGRLSLTHEIHAEFLSIYNKKHKRLEATIYSPVPLTNNQLKQLKDGIGKKQGLEVFITNIIDESIVGGIRIEYEGHELDKTINHFLETLVRDLKK